jgi:hypothetical protein
MVMFAFKLKTPNLKKARRAGDVQGASAVGVLSCRLASLPGVQGGAGVCLQLGLPSRRAGAVAAGFRVGRRDPGRAVALRMARCCSADFQSSEGRALAAWACEVCGGRAAMVAGGRASAAATGWRRWCLGPNGSFANRGLVGKIMFRVVRSR